MKDKLEKRVGVVDIVTRDGKGILTKIGGYAAKFNSLSEDLGGFIEKIAPGAFTEVLKDSDARALVNHDTSKVLGRQSAGTLALKEDKTGLFMEVELPDTTYGRDLAVSVERGDVTQQSFGFTVSRDSWVEKEGETPIRTIDEVGRLYEVSPVTFPAYPETDVALRSLKSARGAGLDLGENGRDLFDK